MNEAFSWNLNSQPTSALPMTCKVKCGVEKWLGVDVEVGSVGRVGNPEGLSRLSTDLFFGSKEG